MLLVGAVFLHTTILDVDGDAAAGKRTTTVKIGVMRSAQIATALAAIAAAATAWRYFGKDGSVVAAVVAALSLVFVVLGHVRLADAEKLESVARSAARVRASSLVVQSITALIALWACLRDPMLIALFVPLMVAARFYYRARFSIRYPG
jgi:1,4-dihydroxy-2-naphthoate octaprenyltransferase